MCGVLSGDGEDLMAARMKLVSGVVAVLMPLAACGGGPPTSYSGPPPSNAQNCAGGLSPPDTQENQTLNYLSVGDPDYIKNTFKEKYGEEDIYYPPGFPGESSTGAGKLKFNALPPVADSPPFEELKSPDELPYTDGANNERVYNDLNVGFSDPAVTKIAGCGLTLRTYKYRNQAGKDVANLVAPTIRVKPGQTMKFTVRNKLSAKLPGASPPGGKFDPTAMVNITNLHTHGLQTSPCGTMVDGSNKDPCDPASAGPGLAASDNVLLHLYPEDYPNPKNIPEYKVHSQSYAIKVADDHPSGTFWYHPHYHGSTAPQVSSGLAGALIVEDDKNNLPKSLQNIKENILVFQSMLYDKNGRLDKLPEGPQVWGDSGRRITINGQVAPVIRMQPGEVQRWRMISASIHELLRVRLAGHDLNEIALDGHYLPQVDTWKVDDQDHGVDLLAGYRSDVLVKASTTPGVYMLVNTPSPWSRFNSPSATEDERQPLEILAAVVVAGNPVQGEALPTRDEMQKIAYKPPIDVNNNPTGDNLKKLWTDNNLSAAPDQNKFGTQDMQFDSIVVPGARTDPDAGLKFSIDGRVYGETAKGEPAEIGTDGKPLTDAPRKLTAGRIDRWNLTTATNRPAATPTAQGAHIFHIHINPFQVARAGPNDTGDDKTELVWKDSIVVPAGPPVTLYTQYDPRFIGKFVAHCHLLDHEDAGMMELMEVRQHW
jgi:FtsP/CotA-like multicopper oxidase with cupredoxin domain